MRACLRPLAWLLPAVGLSTGCASRLFYFPDARVYQRPTAEGYAYEEVSFASRDGTRLTGWLVWAPGEARGTVVHFHGNAQNMTAHYSFVDWLPRAGFNLFVFDYRGYGVSEGEPARLGVYEDSLAAIRYVQQRSDIDTNRIVLLGQSLGGANALAAVGRGDVTAVRAIAAEASFYSYRSIVRDKIGQMPVAGWFKWPLSFLVIGNRYSPGPVVDRIAPIPVVFIHGTADRVIPFHHSEKLHEEAREPKALWPVPGGGHTEAFLRFGSEFRPRLIRFYEEALGE